ncbi:hypothetical protein [Bradyrhizobium sp. B120]
MKTVAVDEAGVQGRNDVVAALEFDSLYRLVDERFADEDEFAV